jgi:hypothetical protein
MVSPPLRDPALSGLQRSDFLVWLLGFDCGVFTCMFADFLFRNLPLVFTQDHMTMCRTKIALMILNGSNDLIMATSDTPNQNILLIEDSEDEDELENPRAESVSMKH